MTTIQKVGVIGAGQMGNGIAHVFATSGHDVILNDIDGDAVKVDKPSARLKRTSSVRSARNSSPRMRPQRRSPAYKLRPALRR